MWYPPDKNELQTMIEKFLIGKKLPLKEKIHGLIVPHAGYVYSGEVAGKAFSLLKEKKMEKSVVIGPSHYVGFYGMRALHSLKTPFGEVKIIKNNFEKVNCEHSVENQIPFLQFLNSKIEVLPLVVGKISNADAEKFAKEISKEKALFVFSTDLCHFLPYEEAVTTDRNTIKIIESLDLEKIRETDACGICPLLIMMNLCRLKNWKPKLAEYKNSGDVTNDKSSVVGYASFYF